MDRSFVSSSVVKCLFLGSRDKVIVAGNAPSTDVQILYGSEELGVDDSFHTVAHYKQPGVCTDFELCGVARLARTYGAIATWDKHNLRASVSLLNLDTQLDEALISLHTADLFTSKFPVSSISFSPEMELLAIATEAGIVSVVELSGGKALCTVKADPCGVLKVQFTRTGQLVTIGESVKSQVKFWDLRSAGDNQAVLTLATELPNQSAGNKAGTGCLCLHPVHERLVSGGSDGMVQLWDLRSTTSLAYASHAGSAGTALTKSLSVCSGHRHNGES